MQNSTFSPSRFDEIRAERPELGFALYAMEPGGVITFEVYTPDGQAFQFVGATADEAMALAFPIDAAPLEPAPEPEETGTIFD